MEKIGENKKKNKILFRYSRNYGYFCQRYSTTTQKLSIK